ncbi:5-methyltetrahydropteroyltriglutamate--homocysteine S-methyltransferase [Acinetobacter faecalis]|uniref:5-methyltetrahydropteroyltriglutamate-- homocysteine S-methyltransferase n=1 Tax=Acinetobacter faecalis TaxID=2665161 RepID=UPI002A90F2BB|nr:5-methyltetrahydropteroyltriglutamate--homocysteine S-methyltransferase [Acinetobacter faecalis]MDY6489417.1 5-methyltetrahydropteroyltriglutamate--homocysteine S-methyltransferase [Acinetobacter faecalis]MDY6530367.1 5-methyltetrahydropteroyltriglutamate--homocysteine S-methyltransferase [Acinetobacter faecalis]
MMTSNTTQATKKQYANNKAEHIGSFLRALKLKKACYDFADRVIYEETLRQVENAEIDNLIDIQLDLDCTVMTDGDFRRAWWHLDFLEQFNGIEGHKIRDGLKYKDAISKPYDVRVTGKISFNEDHTCLAHYRYLHEAIEGFATAKYCLPSPNMMLYPHLRNNRTYAEKLDEYIQDLASSFKQAIMALYAEGCRYIQMNDQFLAYLCDENYRTKEIEQGVNPENLAKLCVEVLNKTLQDKPEDLFIALHIDRGNFSSSWLYSGGYEFLADHVFEKLTNIDRYLLEFDTERSGNFEPLEKLKNSQADVFLGLISSKKEMLETSDEIIERINTATNFLPLERLGLCLQSGFASMEEGNKISYDTQWKKIKLMNRVAQEIWG